MTNNKSREAAEEAAEKYRKLAEEMGVDAGLTEIEAKDNAEIEEAAFLAGWSACLEHLEREIEALRGLLSLARQDRASWKSAHMTLQNAANARIAELEREIRAGEGKDA